MKIKIQTAQINDIQEIKQIYQQARIYMIRNNNTQWGLHYPTNEIIQKDINKKHCYKCILSKRIVAVYSLIPGDDPTYQTIKQGEWLNNAPYSTIHRLASNGEIRGVSTYILKWCLKRDKNIRIDTHKKTQICLEYLK